MAEIEVFKTKYTELTQKLERSIKKNRVYKWISIDSKARELHTFLMNSQIYIQYLHWKENAKQIAMVQNRDYENDEQATQLKISKIVSEYVLEIKKIDNQWRLKIAEQQKDYETKWKKQVEKEKKSLEKLKKSLVKKHEDKIKEIKTQFKQEKEDLESKLEQNKTQINDLQKNLKNADLKVGKFSIETDKLKQKVKKLEDKVAKSEEIVFDNPQLLATTFNHIYESIIGETIEMGEDCDLTLDLSNSKHMKLLNLLWRFKVPNCKELNLKKVPVNNKYVNHFLSNSFPNKVHIFNMNPYGQVLSPIDYYYDSIISISKKVSTEMHVHNFEVSNDQFCNLLKANKNKENGWFGLRASKFETNSELDLTAVLEGFKLKGINLRYSGRGNRSNWASHPEYFTNLIVALGKVKDVRDNLKTIKMYNCGLDEAFIRQQLNENGLQDVEIDGI